MELKRVVTKRIETDWGNCCICKENARGYSGSIENSIPEMKYKPFLTEQSVWNRIFHGKRYCGENVYTGKNINQTLSVVICNDCVEIINNHIVVERKELESERKAMKVGACRTR